MMKLSVNIDHVATLRQARGGSEPSVLEAAKIVENSNADGITMHLREDRRHIQDTDIFAVKDITKLPINLEMALSAEIVDIAIRLKPRIATLVPENRKEITTEGGLDIIKFYDKALPMIKTLQSSGILVSLFIDPDFKIIDASKKIGADIIELHTGSYANAKNIHKLEELEKLNHSAKYAKSIGLNIAAGHGLNYTNTKHIVLIKDVTELNIGHSIISRAVFVGLETAIKEIQQIIKSAE